MPQSIQNKIETLGLKLPAPAAPMAAYVPWRISGALLFVSGQGPATQQGLTSIGKVGAEVSLEDAQKAAQLCALNVLAHALVAVEQDSRRLLACVKLGGFVNCTAEFHDHPKVINGASELIAAAMGARGAHARFAVGAPSLPFNMSVEVEALFEIAPA